MAFKSSIEHRDGSWSVILQQSNYTSTVSNREKEKAFTETEKQDSTAPMYRNLLFSEKLQYALLLDYRISLDVTSCDINWLQTIRK